MRVSGEVRIVKPPISQINKEGSVCDEAPVPLCAPLRLSHRTVPSVQPIERPPAANRCAPSLFCCVPVVCSRGSKANVGLNVVQMPPHSQRAATADIPSAGPATSPHAALSGPKFTYLPWPTAKTSKSVSSLRDFREPPPSSPSVKLPRAAAAKYAVMILSSLQPRARGDRNV